MSIKSWLEKQHTVKNKSYKNHQVIGRQPGRLAVLEPRILLDAAAAAVAIDAIDQSHHVAAETQAATAASFVDIAPKAIAATEANDNPYLAHSNPAADTQIFSDNSQLSSGKQIIFIDANVSDYQALIKGVVSGNEVIVLDANKDGVDQIASILQQRSQEGILYDAIHIVSHGSEGQLSLGSGVLSIASMQNQYANDLGIIGKSLTQNGDILIYGCDFAEGVDGHQAITLLSQYTGADIAASSDLTGASTLGGNWNLEVHSGPIDVLGAFTLATQQNYSYLLSAVTVTWDDLDWPDSSLQHSYDISANNSGNDVTINITGNTERLMPSYPSLTTSLAGGNSEPGNSLELDAQFHISEGDEESVTTTIAFNYAAGVSNISFSIYDVDTGGFTDRVIVTGHTVDGQTVNPSSVSTSIDNSFNGTNTVTGIAPANDSTSDGNATFTFNGTAIDYITIVYQRGDIGLPNQQNIAISDITYTENSAAPILDLNSTPSTSSSLSNQTVNLVTNGDMSRVADNLPVAWNNSTGTNEGAADNGRFVWPGINTDAPQADSFSQAITVLQSSVTSNYAHNGTTLTETTTTTTDAINSIAFDYNWTNTDSTVNTLAVYYNNVLYAQFTTGANSGEQGSWAYFNGASGSENSAIDPVNNASTDALGTNTLTFSAPITQSGDLTFVYDSTDNGQDNIAIDNVHVNSQRATTSDSTTVDLQNNGFSVIFAQNGAAVAIADIDNSIFDADSANLQSAEIFISNPHTGDRLLVDGSSAASGVLASGIAWTRTDTTVTLSNVASTANYANAIELIQFENTSSTPSFTDRVINVTVNDGTNDSNTAISTIHVVPLTIINNPTPVIVLNVSASTLGDFPYYSTPFAIQFNNYLNSITNSTTFTFEEQIITAKNDIILPTIPDLNNLFTLNNSSNTDSCDPAAYTAQGSTSSNETPMDHANNIAVNSQLFSNDSSLLTSQINTIAHADLVSNDSHIASIQLAATANEDHVSSIDIALLSSALVTQKSSKKLKFAFSEQIKRQHQSFHGL